MRDIATRDKILEAADRLFYEQGFEHTSFSHIAEVVQISRGNFYYHFKTKDEILEAVIDLRLENTKEMITQWESDGETPLDHIKSYIRILLQNKNKIMHYGCPVGTLNTELTKLDHVAKAKAQELFTLFREWLAGKFALLGYKKDADVLALHVLSWSQGVATMFNSFQDEGFVKREVNLMCQWVDQKVQT